MTPASERAKAYRLRKQLDQGLPVPEEAAAWLSEYEKRIADSRRATSKVMHVEEHSASEGDASLVPDEGALAKEEGRRLDYLTSAAVNGLIRANEQHQTMSAMLIDRVGALMVNQATLMDSMAHHYLARVQAEAEMIKLKAQMDAAQEGDNDEMLMLLKALGQRFGLIPPDPATPTEGK
jgi:hypothetical protein